MSAQRIRRLASGLLGTAVQLAPRKYQSWGEAMLAELDYMEGGWTAFWWALGGASVLTKRTLLHALLQGNEKHTNPLTEKGSMRKTTLVVAGLCVVCFLGMLFAPVFRQALDVAIWKMLPTGKYYYSDDMPTGRLTSFLEKTQVRQEKQKLEQLLQQAEQRHDADALAYAALEITPVQRRYALLNKAVEWKPELTWLYSVYIARLGFPSDNRALIEKLKTWDPDNAWPHLLEASFIDADKARSMGRPLGQSAQLSDPEWLAAMHAAFQSKTYDTYFRRWADLQRKVMRDYNVTDPLPLLLKYAGYPCPNLLSLRTYSNHMLGGPTEPRTVLASIKGEAPLPVTKFRPEDAWTVVHFAQLMQSDGGSLIEKMIASSIQTNAYAKLESLAERSNDREKALLLGYLLKQSYKMGPNLGKQYQIRLSLSRWNGLVVNLSSVAFLICGTLALIFAAIGITRRLFKRRSNLRAGLVCLMAASISAIGLFLSSLALYISYGPYAYAFDQFLNGKGTDNLSSLDSTFELFTSIFAAPADMYGAMAKHRYWPSMASFGVYFWCGIVLLGLCALLLIAKRHIHRRKAAC